MLQNADMSRLLPLVLAVVFLLGAGLLADVALVVWLFARRPQWSVMSVNMESRPWTWRHAAVFLLVILSAFVVVQMLLLAVCRVTEWSAGDMSSLQLPVGLLSLQLPILACAWGMVRSGAVPFQQAFGCESANFRRDSARGSLLAVAVLPIMWAVSVPYGLVLQHFEMLTPDLQLAMRAVLDVRSAAWYVRGALGIVVLLVVPVAEEVLFRAVVLPVAARRLGTGVAVVLVSLVFSILHGHVASYPALFVLSVALCLAYAYSASIVVPIVMHSTFNLIQIALQLFVNSN